MFRQGNLHVHLKRLTTDESPIEAGIRLYHIGVGQAHKGERVILLVDGLVLRSTLVAGGRCR